MLSPLSSDLPEVKLYRERKCWSSDETAQIKMRE